MAYPEENLMKIQINFFD